MWLDTLVLVVLACFGLAGAVRGGLASALSVITLLGAYAAAIFAATHYGASAAERLGLSEFVGPPLAGVAAFFVGYFGLGIASAVLKRRERRRRNGSRSAGDRLIGMGFGALRGGVVVLLLCMLAIWLDAFRSAGLAPFVPELGSSRAAEVTESVVEAGVLAAVDGEGPDARFLARMASRPAASIAELGALIDDPRIQALQGDTLFWTYVENGAVDNALNRSSFFDIIHDDALRAHLAELGLVDTDTASDPIAFRDAADAALRELGPRLQALRDDPALQRLVDDPEVVALLRSGRPAALLAHPGFRGFVADVATR